MNKDELIRKLVVRIEALEAARIYLETQRPIPDQIHDALLDTSEVLQKARNMDWVSNVGI